MPHEDTQSAQSHLFTSSTVFNADAVFAMHILSIKAGCETSIID